MEPWTHLGSKNVIYAGDLVAVIDWTQGKTSQANRELIGYARVHGFLTEDGREPGTLVITKDRVFLLGTSPRSMRKKLDRT